MTPLRIRLLAAGSVLTGTALLAFAAPPRYVVTDLETLGGPGTTSAPGSVGYALDDLGVVVGLSMVADGEAPLRAFSWDAVMMELPPTSAHAHSTAFARNNSGDVVGIAFDLGELVERAVRWQGSTPTELGGFFPRDVNALGSIVGRQPLPPLHGEFHAVRWENGGLIDLDTLGGTSSEAFAVDDLGRIVGGSLLSDNLTTRAFIWQNGTMHDLGTLGGTASQAYDISNAGHVVGVAETAAGASHAFLFTIDANGAVTSRSDLGTLAGGWSYAYSVNEAAEVVGTSDSRAFLYRDAAMHDLNNMIRQDLGWSFFRANSINELGQITGSGMHNGLPRAFLLTPVIPGDLDGDGDVDQSDLGILLASYGINDGGDVDGDGDTDQSDLGLLLANYGAGT